MLKQIKNHFIMTPIILVVIVLSLVVSIQSVSGYNTEETEEEQQQLLSILSTRNVPIFFPADITKLVSDTITKFDKNKTCPSDIAIYIHGFNKSKDDAGEEFNRIQTALNLTHSTIPLIGFSWDSKVPWQQAKVNAKTSGEELAKFIYEFKDDNNCPQTNIRIIAHSLGASVVDNALTNLDTYLNAKTNTNSKIIKSVDLLGAAISNKLIANNSALGDAIENIVVNFTNLYSSKDDGLEINRYIEKHNPLGLVGAAKGTEHLNYNDKNVTSELPPISDADCDGNLEECFEDISPVKGWGDNHCGYIGFRQPFSNSLLDDGAIDVVVEQWKS